MPHPSSIPVRATARRRATRSIEPWTQLGAAVLLLVVLVGCPKSDDPTPVAANADRAAQVLQWRSKLLGLGREYAQRLASPEGRGLAGTKTALLAEYQGKLVAEANALGATTALATLGSVIGSNGPEIDQLLTRTYFDLVGRTTEVWRSHLSHQNAHLRHRAALAYREAALFPYSTGFLGLFVEALDDPILVRMHETEWPMWAHAVDGLQVWTGQDFGLHLSTAKAPDREQRLAAWRQWYRLMGPYLFARLADPSGRFYFPDRAAINAGVPTGEYRRTHPWKLGSAGYGSPSYPAEAFDAWDDAAQRRLPGYAPAHADLLKVVGIGEVAP